MYCKSLCDNGINAIKFVSVNKYKTCKLLNIKDMMKNLLTFASVAKKTTQLLSTVARLRLLLVMLLTLCVSAAWGAEEVVYTLTPADGANNSYTSTCDIEIDGITWNLAGNSQMDPWRIGGKSITNVDRALYSKTAIQEDISKIVISHGAASDITVNSVKLIVSTASNGTGTTISSLDGSFSANSTMTFTRPAGTSWANAYYKFVYNVTVSGSKNKYVEFEEAKFYAETAPAVQYSITFNAGSGTCDTESLTETSAGAGVTLPPATIDCGDVAWTFAGWAEASVGSETEEAPSTLYEAGDTYKPTSNITLYAVYKRTEEGEGGGGGDVTESVDFSTMNYTNQQEIASYDGTNFSVEFNEGTNSNTPKYYTSGTAIRVYGGGYFIVSSESTITKIVLSFGTGDGTNTITTDVNTYSSGTWTGSATSVKFTIGGTSGNRRIKVIAVTTSGGGSSSTTYYHSTPQCSTETLPSMTASVSSLEFGNVKVNQSSQKTFTLSGSNLTADATLALSGTNAGMFSVSPTSVTQSSGSITNKTITVTYTPTAKASHSAILTISSPGAEPPIQISLSGTGVAQTADYTVNHYQQNITDDNYTLKETETPYGEVGTSVTPAVKSYTGFTAPSTETVTIKADGTTVVKYYYTRNSYTLTWDVNEGNDLTGEYTSGSVKFGATITKPADPTRAGYNFSGWHNGTAIVTPATTMPADNLTYTAQWKQVYTITWLVDGKSYPTGNPTTSVEDGQNITAIPSDPPLLSCAVKFMGWSTQSSGSTPENPSYYSDLFTTLDEAEAINIDDNKTFHAVFATNEETIEGAGTEWVKTELSAVTEGTYALLTTNGYAFNGSISSGHGQVTTNTFSFTDNIATSAPDGTCEITFEAVSGGFKMYNANNGYLYAKDSKSGQLAWHAEEKSYWYSDKYSSNNWTYDANDAVLRSYNNGSIRTYGNNTGELLVLAKKTTSSATVFTAFITSCCETPAPTNGTYTDVAGSGSSMSVKLTWEDAANVGRYHITGGNLGDNAYANNATNYTISGLTECEDYTFYVSAYHPTGDCESATIEIPVKPYIPKTVTFDDGTTTTTQTTSCTSKTVIVPTPTAQNCSTYVWIDEATGTEYTDGQTITPANDMTIVAKWSVETYTITFNDWDGTQLQQTEVECGQTPAYNGETPTRPENNTHQYTFAAWTPTIVPADSDATYAATYTQTQHQITVIWMVNGEEYTEGEPSPMVLAGEKVAKLPTPPSPDDYCGQVFAGWTDQPINSAPIADAPDVLFNTPEASPTLYKEGDKTTVTFYAVFADIKE